MPEALELYERVDEFDEEEIDINEVAAMRCESKEEVVRGGKRATIYKFKDGSLLTVAETGYIGCEYK